MTREQRIAEYIRDWTARKLAEGPEACRRYLIELGIYDETGNLTPEYGGTVPDAGAATVTRTESPRHTGLIPGVPHGSDSSHL